jgi:enoyl-CoA hydratase/carnithine racemase
MEIKWGIIPDMAMTTSLPYLMNIDRALEMAMTADILDSDEAFGKGLITAIKEKPLEEARALAKKIANKSPDAIRSIKRLFYQTWHKNDEFSLSLEAKLQLQVMSGSNQMEAVKSSLSGAVPDFSNSKM